MVARNLSLPHDFVCYTDQKLDGVEYRSTNVDWPGWWQKVALFRGGPKLYLDLDVVITGSIDDYADRGELTIIRDWWGGRFNSSVMWIENRPDIYEKFRVADIDRWPGGDQDWIHACAPEAATFDDGIRSYKAHVRDRGLGNARIVVFHGKPKPDEVDEPWIAQHWR